MSKWDKLIYRIRTLSSPKHKTIKKVYVELVKEIVESEVQNNENN